MLSFSYYGISFGDDARALSEDEIRDYQTRLAPGMVNAASSYDWNQLRNAYAPPELPLDERFASFKKRLAEALTKLAH